MFSIKFSVLCLKNVSHISSNKIRCIDNSEYYLCDLFILLCVLANSLKCYVKGTTSGWEKSYLTKCAEKYDKCIKFVYEDGTASQTCWRSNNLAKYGIEGDECKKNVGPSGKNRNICSCSTDGCNGIFDDNPLKCYDGFGAGDLKHCQKTLELCVKVKLNNGTTTKFCATKKFVAQYGVGVNECIEKSGGITCTCSTDGCNSSSFIKSSMEVQLIVPFFIMITASPLIKRLFV